MQRIGKGEACAEVESVLTSLSREEVLSAVGQQAFLYLDSKPRSIGLAMNQTNKFSLLSIMISSGCCS